MSTAAGRRVRGARNAVVDLLGLGESLPLRDLPVSAAPPIAPFGGSAAVEVQDSEPGVQYRLRAQAGGPLPGDPVIAATGDGGSVGLTLARIEDSMTFTVLARRPSGRSALLLGSGQVRIGLDASLPVSVPGDTPVVVDHGARVTLLLARSQEGVSYRLVGRPDGDQARPDDLLARATDIDLSEGGEVRGTGGAIALPSKPLSGDTTVRVRVVKTFGGPRETQTTLLTQAVPVAVRAARDRAMRVSPAIIGHGGAPAIEIEKAEPGVRYQLFTSPVADTQFDRAEPPDASAVAAAGDDGPIRVRRPELQAIWQVPPGFEPAGDETEGAGRLSLRLPPLTRDTLVAVRATKRHTIDEATFATQVALDAVVLVPVRPDPEPGLRLEAMVAGNKLVRLRVPGGQPGVFYRFMAGDVLLGEAYLHQLQPDDAKLNKGIDGFAVEVDLVVAADDREAPPVPRLDLEPRGLPLSVAITARRATTRLVQKLADATIAAAPAPNAEPQTVAPGAAATVSLPAADAANRYALLVDDRAVAIPVAGTGARLALETGPLAAGARVELLVIGPANKGIAVEQRIAVPLTVA